jgi:spore germination protein GerM
MKQQQGSKRISSGVIAAVSAAVVAVGGGVAWLTSNSNHSSSSSNSNSAPTAITPPASQLPTTTPNQINNEQTAQIYFLKDTGKNIALVPQSIKVKADPNKPNQVLEAALNTLLAGSNNKTDSTTIPKGTKLLGLNMKDDGIHVNLSQEFTSGGGSTSMIGRVGQVLYTATSLDPTAKVYIEVNGNKLDVIGGEGLELEQPLTRNSFQKNYQL